MKPEAAAVRPSLDWAKVNRLERIIDKAESSYVDVGRALESIKAVMGNYRKFIDHCENLWGWAESTVCEKIQAANIAVLLRQGGVIPASQKMAMDLAGLEVTVQKQCWKAAVDTARGRLTRAHLAKCIEEVTGLAPGAMPGELSEIQAAAYDALPAEGKAQYQKLLKEQLAKAAAPREPQTFGGDARAKHLEQAACHFKLGAKHLEALGDGEAEAELEMAMELMKRVQKLESA